MKTRKLGQTDIEVAAIGYGCMGQTHSYGVVEREDDMVALMRYAHEVGYTARYDALAARYEKLQARHDGLQKKRERRQIQADELSGFLFAGRLVFRFRNGAEITEEM